MTPEQAKAINGKRRDRRAAEVAFQAHAADCPPCRTHTPEGPADECKEGQRLESKIADAWIALEEAKRAAGMTF
jgi:hypothetical protein